jgi:hypothetical protein
MIGEILFTIPLLVWAGVWLRIGWSIWRIPDEDTAVANGIMFAFIGIPLMMFGGVLLGAVWRYALIAMGLLS